MKNNLFANKSFGQNFLIDRNILNIIIDAAEIAEDDTIIEIGPGLGVLTEELCKKAKKVLSIELDRNMVRIVKENMKDRKNLEIIEMDALTFTPPEIKYKVVANIPYNITSPLISLFLGAKNRPTTITLLTQKEVAEKIGKVPPYASILPLRVGLNGTAKIIQKVSKNCFYPAPKVDSAILKIKLNDDFSQEEILQIEKIAKIAFSGKRKKLSNTLKTLIPNKENFPVDLEKRPQNLSLEEWRTLAKNC
ncbi:MAG: 16S rRNA (adenine(1518)-N(6)/adenine(1519)-N(6))-dimethyltransferase RsmA [Candidatus Gracilibacteria bacterium]